MNIHQWINDSMNQSHPVAMELDLFGERRSCHGLGAAGSAKVNFWLDNALENRTIASLTPVFGLKV